MITRKEYMSDSSNLHHDYYAQFVTEETKSFVLTRIGMNKLLASKDGHLNDIAPMGPQGWIWDYSPMSYTKAREAGEMPEGNWASQSCHTCVGKAAARILLAEYLEMNA